ncbi:MAG: ABC transporter ATP-binding protein [Nocardioidaceae bacterium]|nr:ABC transporter ATP-binding protein [Nocardioidaceae bacterium]
MADAVRLDRVTRLFDGAAAVTALDLTVPVGEVLLVEGANGSGKSTLLRVVATALSPTFGSGTVLGADLVRHRSWIRARVELLGHESRCYPDLTAAENLRFVCSLFGDAPAGVGPALERAGLEDVADVRAGSFSQGMRQRLALARTLVRRPELLLLDEPYAALDADARGLVDDVVTEGRRWGQTVLLASHEAPPAGLVDRTVRMDAGRLAAEVPA